MKTNNINYLLEYSSLIMIMSYLLLHSIKLVFIGILFSLYLINKSLIDNILKLNKNRLNIKTNDNINRKGEIKDNNLSKSNSVCSLVERVEELGFIPSKDNSNNSNAA